MEYLDFRKVSRALVLTVVLSGLATVASADPGTAGSYNQGFWGQVAGPRVCDATNEDGYCIAWHSTLRGIAPERLAQCTGWSCDLRPGTRPARPVRDDSVAQQLAVTQHEIAPLVMDGTVKAVKAAKKTPQVRIDGPSGSRDEYGPIVPRVIEVPAK